MPYEPVQYALERTVAGLSKRIKELEAERDASYAAWLMVSDELDAAEARVAQLEVALIAADEDRQQAVVEAATEPE
jgi:hypothetical protein